MGRSFLCIMRMGRAATGLWRRLVLLEYNSGAVVPAGQPTFDHVVLLVEENHSYSDVIGNSSMPYFNSLASQYGVAAQYFANAHPSIPNYMVLTTGLDGDFG